MASQGATLQNYNNELVKSIEEMQQLVCHRGRGRPKMEESQLNGSSRRSRRAREATAPTMSNLPTRATERTSGFASSAADKRFSNGSTTVDDEEGGASVTRVDSVSSASGSSSWPWSPRAMSDDAQMTSTPSMVDALSEEAVDETPSSTPDEISAEDGDPSPEDIATPEGGMPQIETDAQQKWAAQREAEGLPCILFEGEQLMQTNAMAMVPPVPLAKNQVVPEDQLAIEDEKELDTAIEDEKDLGIEDTREQLAVEDLKELGTKDGEDLDALQAQNRQLRERLSMEQALDKALDALQAKQRQRKAEKQSLEEDEKSEAYGILKQEIEQEIAKLHQEIVQMNQTHQRELSQVKSEAASWERDSKKQKRKIDQLEVEAVLLRSENRALKKLRGATRSDDSGAANGAEQEGAGDDNLTKLAKSFANCGLF